MAEKNAKPVDEPAVDAKVKGDNTVDNGSGIPFEQPKVDDTAKSWDGTYTEITNDELKVRITDLVRAGASTAQQKIELVEVYAGRDDDADEDRIQYRIAFKDIRGYAYVYPSQIARMLPVSIDVNDVNKVGNMLKMARSADIIALDLEEGDTFRFNLYSDNEHIATTDRRHIYITGLNYGNKLMDKLQDKVVDMLFD